jgi:glutathione synthase/RimK-type ligase-like ATP-grasp enzyme
METALTLKEFIAKHGEEKTAFKLVDKRIESIFGLSIFDLPDTSEVAELVEELADVLHDNPNDKESIKSILNQIDIEFIERIVYG